jgi:hypothetical protein
MPSQPVHFRVGEKVCYPQIICNREGKHEVIKLTWQIKTIFPVSQVAIIKQMNVRKAPSIQVGLAQLANYN